MNRDQVIRRLRKLARKRGIPFDLDKTKGDGSHYRVRFGERVTTIQDKLNPGRIERILKQLDLSPAEF